MRRIFVFLLFLLISPSSTFDYIEYVQQWPPAMCKVSNEKSMNSCAFSSAVSGWTTQGVWPDNEDGTYPNYCTSESFDESQIKSIEPALQVTWPDLVTSDSGTEFWSSEWLNHGTCCYGVPQYSGQLNYFNSSISLNAQMNLYNNLHNNGVKPSLTYWYTRSQISTALNKIFGGVTTIYLCVTDQNDGIEYLSSIRVCVNLDAQRTYRDCSSVLQGKKDRTGIFNILSNNQPYSAPCQSDKIYYLPLGTSPSTTAAPATFDYVIYAEQWPPALCKISNENSAGSCAFPRNVRGWTTHGVWPDNNDGSYPSHCHIAGYNFDPTLIAPIEQQLDQTWPNLVAADSNDDFWSHEWEKHGTCMTSIPMYTGELNYFNSSIMLNGQVNLYSNLCSNGIITSMTATYTQSAIYDALKNIFGTVVEVMCVKDSDKNEYLSSIRICIDKNDNTKYIDCPKNYFIDKESTGVILNYLPNPNQCSTNKIFYLPLSYF